MTPKSGGERPASTARTDADAGSFDSELASLREAISPLRMTSSHNSFLPVTRAAACNVQHAAHFVLLD